VDLASGSSIFTIIVVTGYSQKVATTMIL